MGVRKSGEWVKGGEQARQVLYSSRPKIGQIQASIYDGELKLRTQHEQPSEYKRIGVERGGVLTKAYAGEEFW